MKYLAFVGSVGPQPVENREQMGRDWPAYARELEARGVWKIGRPLNIDEPAATVRVRDGETLVSDGPFAETKEFVGGLDLLDCADLDEAIEIEGKSPVGRFLPLEVRPFAEGVRLGTRAEEFGREEDAGGTPYLLSVWVADPSTALGDGASARAYDDWRSDLEARGRHVLGGALGGPETATTLRYRDGETRLADGPFLEVSEVEGYIAGIDVVGCANRQDAIALAATHPYARDHAIELRRFDSQADFAARMAAAGSSGSS